MQKTAAASNKKKNTGPHATAIQIPWALNFIYSNLILDSFFIFHCYYTYIYLKQYCFYGYINKYITYTIYVCMAEDMNGLGDVCEGTQRIFVANIINNAFGWE